MNIFSFTKALLNRVLIDSFSDVSRRHRLQGALELLEQPQAIAFGGWKPGLGDWYKVKSRSTKHNRIYEVSDKVCQCGDHYYHGENAVCSHRELVRAFVKASRLLPHVQALEKEGVAVAL